MAKSMIRVLLSVPNLTGEFVEKGSRCWVTDSKEIARVESSWLMRIGAAVCAEVFETWTSIAPAKSALKDNASKIRKHECEAEIIAEIRHMTTENWRTM
jgi:hypothetical protein